MKLALLVLASLLMMGSALASKLSEAEMNAITKTVNDGAMQPDNANVSVLKNLALAKFNKLQKAADCKKWGYCPDSGTMKVQALGKTYTILAVTWMNDGAFSGDLYSQDGTQHIADFYDSESGDGVYSRSKK
jgi:hypothetical protein